MENIKLKNGFTQVCIMEGAHIGESTKREFESFMEDNFQVRSQFLEQVETLPDLDRRGIPIKDTGGRDDIIFAIHDDDINHFITIRLKAGIRWIEDIYSNGHGHRYPSRLAEYRSWSY